MKLYPWTVQINRENVKDWGSSDAPKKFVYGDSVLLAAKFQQYDPTTNEFTIKDFTADGGLPQALRVLIRADRDSSSTLYVFQDVYNAGILTGFADLTLGQVEWVLPFSDSAIKTDLDANGGTLTVWLEVSYLDGTGYPSTLAQQQVTIVDQVDDGAAGTPPPESPTYLTAAEIAAIYIPKTGESGGQTIYGGTDAGDDLILDSTSNATKGDIILQPSGGQVLIGSAAPVGGEKLHVAGSYYGTSSINAIGSAATHLRVYNSGETAYRTWSKQAGAHIACYQSDAGSPFTKTTDIVAGGDGTVPTEIRFLTSAQGSSNLSESMRINDSGQVLIGSAAPVGSEKLYVNGAYYGTGNIALATTAVGDQFSITTTAAYASTSLERDSGSIAGGISKWSIVSGVNGSTKHFGIEDVTSGGTGLNSPLIIESGMTANAIRINSSGNVLIGSTAPFGSEKLYVGGDVYATGAILCVSVLTSSNNGVVHNNATGTYSTWQYNSVGNGDVGTGNQIVGGGSTLDFGVTSRAGNLLLGTASTERMRIDSSGNVLIGTTSSYGSEKLGVNGDVYVNGTIRTESVDFDTTGSLKAYKAGQMQYDPDSKSFIFDTGITDVRYNGGEELWYPAINKTGVTITNGSVVYASGVDATTNEITIALADADSIFTSVATLGVVTADIANDAQGKVTFFGRVRGVNLSALSQGGLAYLSGTPGGLTQTLPTYPQSIIGIGTVTNNDSVNGEIFVSVNLIERRDGSKDYNFTSQGIGTGTFYRSGYYDAPAADANLTQASTTITYGTANVGYAAHAFIVAGGAGTVDSGTVGIRVTGDSITDAGVLTTSDTEILTTDITTLSLNDYIESSKKWVGTHTYELYVSSGTPTTYSLDFNYGYAKYEDIGNRDFTVTDFEAVGLAGANDTSFDIQLLHHKATGWTYSAAAFVPGNSEICGMSTDMSPDDNLSNGKNFAYKRANLDTFIDGNASEGVIVRITTSANNAVQSMDIHIGGVLEGYNA